MTDRRNYVRSYRVGSDQVKVRKHQVVGIMLSLIRSGQVSFGEIPFPGAESGRQVGLDSEDQEVLDKVAMSGKLRSREVQEVPAMCHVR